MIKLLLILLGSLARGCFLSLFAWLVTKGWIDAIPNTEVIGSAVDEIVGWAGIILSIGFSVWRTYLLKASNPNEPTYANMLDKTSTIMKAQKKT